jgi:hypothetical protein
MLARACVPPSVQILAMSRVLICVSAGLGLILLLPQLPRRNPEARKRSSPRVRHASHCQTVIAKSYPTTSPAVPSFPRTKSTGPHYSRIMIHSQYALSSASVLCGGKSSV